MTHLADTVFLFPLHRKLDILYPKTMVKHPGEAGEINLASLYNSLMAIAAADMVAANK